MERRSPMERRARIASFDGLRGLAAVAVMLFHFDVFFLPQARLRDLIPGLSRAYLSVDLFFLLSGFVMAHVYGLGMAGNWRAHWRDFAVARVARIYPLFLITTLALVVIVAASGLSLAFVSFSLRALCLQPLLLQSAWPGLSWNYPGWSLSTESAAYVFFVFAARSLLSGPHPRLLAAASLAVLAALSIAHHGNMNLYSGPFALLRTFSEFSLGMLIFRAHSEENAWSRRWSGVLLAAALASAVLFAHQDCTVVYALACLVLCCAESTGVLRGILNSRPAVALGNWSYSIYLWHVPTHCALMALFAAIGHPVNRFDLSGARLLVLATLLVVCGLSALSYRCVEVPLRRRWRSAWRSAGNLSVEAVVLPEPAKKVVPSI